MHDLTCPVVSLVLCLCWDVGTIGVNGIILIKNLKRRYKWDRRIYFTNFCLQDDLLVDFIAFQKQLMQEGNS